MEPRIRRIIQLMTVNLRHELQLNELARSLNLSESRLRHLFKKETGISPVQYLKGQRMQKAKELFEKTYLNVKEVMLHVGISDQSHFVKDFKKIYGLSPAKYRNQYLSQKGDSEADDKDGQWTATAANK